MATHLQNKISVDVAADEGSADSLSFAGLICIQDQQSKLPPDDLLVSNGRNESSSRGSSPATHGRSRRPDGMKVKFKPNHKVRIQANTERTAASSGFGRKLFQSFFSPCRQCHAITPTAKAHTAPGENPKLH